jgi:hypothetical protein
VGDRNNPVIFNQDLRANQITDVGVHGNDMASLN